MRTDVMIEAERFDNEYDVFRAMKQARKERSSARRDDWEAMFNRGDLPGWTRFTETHYRYVLNDRPLDYWPGKKKWQYEGKIHTGDVIPFIDRRKKS